MMGTIDITDCMSDYLKSIEEFDLLLDEDVLLKLCTETSDAIFSLVTANIRDIMHDVVANHKRQLREEMEKKTDELMELYRKNPEMCTNILRDALRKERGV